MTRAIGCWAIACAAVGCGRVGFDARDGGGGVGDGAAPDATMAGAFSPIALPAGGSVNQFALGTDGSRYVIGYFSNAFRSTDGMTWTACGDVAVDGISVDADGTIYVAAVADVYASVDHCATWQPTNLGQTALSVYAVHGQIYAGTPIGLEVYSAGTWAPVSTPLDGEGVDVLAADSSGAFVIAGNDDTGGIAQRPGFGSAWQQATGTSTGDINAIAVSASDATRAYAFEGAQGGNTGDLIESTDSGATWTAVYQPGGLALAIDPTNPDHTFAAVYDDLVTTTDAFNDVDDGQRGVIAPADVYGIMFEPSGAVLAATESGVYESASSTALDWQPRSIGLEAWQINGIAATDTEIYLAADGGILYAFGSNTFTLSTDGFTGDVAIARILVVDSGAYVFSTGHAVSMSTDGGLTWPTVYSPDDADYYYSQAIATDGTRVYVGTSARLVYADPPYNDWSPVTVAGVEALTVADGNVWAACDDGLFAATTAGLSFTQIAGVPGGLTSVAALPDGSIIVGSFAGVWISDPTVTTFTHSLASSTVTAIAVAGTTIILAALDGVHASHDRGATWTDVPGLDTRAPNSIAIDPATGDLLVGTAGMGLWRAPVP